MSNIVVDPPTLVCANHPNVETTLRCNRCEKPICSKCAVLTPTGYRCKECVRGEQKRFENAEWYDYILIFVVVGGLSYLGSLLVTLIGFFTIFLAPGAGLVMAEAARRVTGRRRAKRLFQLAAIAAVVGALPLVLRELVYLLLPGNFAFNLLRLVWLGVYLFIVPSTIYARLRGIAIR